MPSYQVPSRHQWHPLSARDPVSVWGVAVVIFLKFNFLVFLSQFYLASYVVSLLVLLYQPWVLVDFRSSDSVDWGGAIFCNTRSSVLFVVLSFRIIYILLSLYCVPQPWRYLLYVALSHMIASLLLKQK